MIYKRILFALLFAVAIVRGGAAQAPDTSFDPRVLTRTEIQLIQDGLIWNGLYLGLKDGGWGRLTEDGLRNWRQRMSSSQIGGPTPREFARLTESARAAQQEVGWTTWRDPSADVWIGYPSRLVRPVPFTSNYARGHDYVSGNTVLFRTRQTNMTFADLRASVSNMQNHASVEAVTYRLDRADRQVLSQRLRNGTQQYVRFDAVGSQWRGFLVDVPENYPFPTAISALSADFNAAGTPIVATPSDTPNLRSAPLAASAAPRPPPPPIQAQLPTPAPVASQPAAPPPPPRVDSPYFTRLAAEGAGQDLLALVNISPTAPNAALNLSGDVSFLSNRAIACRTAEPPTDLPQAFALTDWLRARGIETRQITLGPCGAGAVERMDLVILRRAELATLNTALFNNLARSAEARGITAVILLAEATAREEASMRRAARNENEALIEADAPGFGFIGFASAGNNICVAASGNTEVWQRIIREEGRKLQLDAGTSFQPVLTQSDLDAAFIAARRGNCRFVVGSGAQLRTVLGAVRRDQLQASVGTAWVIPERLRAAEQDSQASAAMALQAAEQQRQRLEQERQLRAAREEAEGIERARRTAALRTASQVQATAMREFVTQAARGLHANESTASTRWGRDAFRPLDQHIRQRLNEGWELQGVEAEVFEFGQSQWSGRRLATGVIKISFRTSNRVIGRYDTTCFLLAYQDDAEFRMTRETHVSGCDDAGKRQTASWLTRLSYESLWNAR